MNLSPSFYQMQIRLEHFSRIDDHFIHKENVCQYIHVDLEEYNHEKLRYFKNNYLVDNSQRLKSEFNSLGHKGLDTWNYFSMIDDEEIVIIIHRRIHGEFIWFDGSYLILKEVIQIVKGYVRLEKYLC